MTALLTAVPSSTPTTGYEVVEMPATEEIRAELARVMGFNDVVGFGISRDHRNKTIPGLKPGACSFWYTLSTVTDLEYTSVSYPPGALILTRRNNHLPRMNLTIKTLPTLDEFFV